MPARAGYVLAVAGGLVDPYEAMLPISGPFGLQICVGDSCQAVVEAPAVTDTCDASLVATTCSVDHGLATASSASWYCTNKPNIDVLLRLMNLNGADMVGATLSADFASGGETVYSHGTALSINGAQVVSGIVPSQHNLSGSVPLEALVEGWQTLNLRSVHPQGNQAHYIVAGNFTLRVEFRNYTSTQCMDPQQLVDASTPTCEASPGVEIIPTDTPPIFCISRPVVDYAPGLNIRPQPNWESGRVG